MGRDPLWTHQVSEGAHTLDFNSQPEGSFPTCTAAGLVGREGRGAVRSWVTGPLARRW